MRKRVGGYKYFFWVSLLCLCACGTHSTDHSRVVLKHDSISLVLPQHWQAGLANGDVRYSAHPLDAAGQVIAGADFYIERGIAPAAGNAPALTAYAMALAANIQALSRDFQQSQPKSAQLGGQPALSVEREYSDTTGSYHEWALLVIHNHVGYSFVGRTRTADFERLRPDIKAIFDSIQWQTAK